MSKKSFFTLLVLSISIASCASNKNKKVGDTGDYPTIKEVPIDVGSIVAKMELINSTAEELEANEVMVKIVEVVGYGASTQPLAVNQVLIVKMRQNFDKMAELKAMEVGQTFEGVITKSMGMDMGSGSKGTWNILKIN
ncbi:MAG: hypothetical protein RLN81_12150 [Balneolaceae bacterium]